MGFQFKGNDACDTVLRSENTFVAVGSPFTLARVLNVRFWSALRTSPEVQEAPKTSPSLFDHVVGNRQQRRGALPSRISAAQSAPNLQRAALL
jgi:hypothetical protein